MAQGMCVTCHGGGFPLPPAIPPRGNKDGCPECGLAYNPDTAKECPGCHSMWPAEVVQCPHCKTSL